MAKKWPKLSLTPLEGKIAPELLNIQIQYCVYAVDNPGTVAGTVRPFPIFACRGLG